MEAIKNKTEPKTSEQVLLVTHTFDAPIDFVFKAWTDPDRVMKWWGPKNFTCPFYRIDLRPGGTYLYCLRSSDGKNYWGTGTYLEIIEPEHIVYTDNFADENGNIVSPKSYGLSADWPNEAIITVDFSEDSGKTTLTLQHSPIKPGKERDMCRDGWNELLDKLTDYLANENI